MTESTKTILSPRIELAGFMLENGGRPFIVAEIGVNHNGDLALAKEMIAAAKDCGADAVKFQTFFADELVTKTAPMAKYQERNTGAAESQHELLRRLELSFEAHSELAGYCRQRGVFFLSTPFGFAAADLLRRLNVAAFKVSSSDTNNVPFLLRLARDGKPLILSSGMSDLGEIEETVEALAPVNRDIILLQCTSEYPCPPEEAHLSVIETFRARFGGVVGFSDHTAGSEAAFAAAALGAAVIEKHFTLSRTLPGPDHIASTEPAELKSLVQNIRGLAGLSPAEKRKRAEALPAFASLLGSGAKEVAEVIKKSGVAAVAKKSVIALTDLPAGTVLEERMLAVKRPGTGIAPKHFSELPGRRTKRIVRGDTPLTWDDLE